MLEYKWGVKYKGLNWLTKFQRMTNINGKSDKKNEPGELKNIPATV